MQLERTLVIIKPDIVGLGRIGEIITRFERARMRIAGLKMYWLTDKEAEGHYAEAGGKYGRPILDAIVTFMTAIPVVAVVLEGPGVVAICRKMIGTTDPSKSPPGTIRADFAHMSIAAANEDGYTVENVIHASESVEDARQEITRFFRSDEVFVYTRPIDGFIQAS